MNTENENWHESSNNEESNDAGRDGYKTFNRDGYNRQNDRPSYNRESNYNREGGYQNRSYGDRPQQSSYNRYGNNENSGYNRSTNDRPQRPYVNREGGDRPYRPRFNPNEGGDQRPRFNPNNEGGDQRPRFNREGGDRPYRPRFNPNEGGEQRPRFNPNNEGGDQRPRFNREEGTGGYQNRSYGDRPQHPYNQDRPSWRSNNEGGERPRFQRPAGGNSYGNSYNNRGGDDRPYRPRYSNDGRPSGGYQRPYRTDDYDPNAKYSKKKQIEYKELHFDPDAPIRLNKYLANAGVCSRREADEYITAGVVSVNGVVITELGTKVKRSDSIKFHEGDVTIERKAYILLNKPKDCVTTSDDPQDRKTVMDMVKGACNERIYPVGRLDRNTTGVLLLTNDGDLASKLTHPQYLKKKIYQVTTDRNITRADMDQIKAGIQLEDGEIRADDISYADEIKRNVVGIEIHTGQNRIVRRIFESLGYKVMKLDRVYFAGLTKKGLRRGEWRYLTENEVSFLKMGSFN